MLAADVLRNNLHLHLPVINNGQLRWRLVAFNTKPADIFTIAESHDLSGNTEWATEDYLYCIDSEAFKTLPPKIRVALRELADMRASAAKDNYLEELICHSEVHYWPANRLPIKVYLPDSSSAHGFSALDRKLVKDSFDEWMALVPGKLSYQFVSNKEDADLVFSQRRDSGELGSSRMQAAHRSLSGSSA